MRSSRLVRETLQYFVEDVGCGEKGAFVITALLQPC